MTINVINVLKINVTSLMFLTSRAAGNNIFSRFTREKLNNIKCFFLEE